MDYHKLTRRETETLHYLGHGFSIDEIGDKMCVSGETVKKHICNTKAKLHLQKSTELVAYYWCTFFGVSFKERRDRILSITLFVLIIFFNPVNDGIRRVRRVVTRRYRTEVIFQIEAEL